MDTAPPDISPRARERVAQSLHAQFLLDRLADGTLDPSRASHAPWESLNAADREQNYGQVDRVMRLHAMVGLHVLDCADGVGIDHPSAEEVERMAQLEHDAWVARKAGQGYVYGPVRDDGARPPTHPDMVPWEQLDEWTREKDRAPVRGFGRHVAAAGLGLQRDAPLSLGA